MPLSDTERERVEAYFDGDLTPDAAAEFCGWLRGDPEHTREFVRAAHLHRALRDELKGRSIRVAESRIQKPERASAWRNWKLWGAAAAVLILAGYGVYRSAFPDPVLTVFAAKIESVSGPVFVVDGDGLLRNPVGATRYLNSNAGLEFEGPGKAVLKYFDGSTLDFTVNSTRGALRLNREESKPRMNGASNGKRVTIEGGLLMASVARQTEGNPLIISTPQAEVMVVGTRFRLEVTANLTRLDVLEGKVRIVRYSDAARVDVAGGEFVIVNSRDPLSVRRAEGPPPGPPH